jgi:hypothetical protein
MRRAAIFALHLVMTFTMSAGHAEAASAHADLSGIWKAIHPSALLQTTDGQPPPLLPAARKVYEANLAARKAGDTSFDTTTRCMPPSIPRAFVLSSFRIMPQPTLVAFLFEWNHRYRPVYLGAAHESDVNGYEEYFGDAVGIWKGNDLVVDSVGISTTTLLDDALPHSEKLHVIERYRLANDRRALEVELTIDDPDTFSKSWTTRLRFVKQPRNTELKEDVCVNRVGLVPTPTGGVVDERAIRK